MSALSSSLPDAKELFRIIHVDDEDWLLKMVGLMIQENQAFKNVTVQTFQNRNAAWLELLQADPDLLITDLRSDNVPGQTKKFGISGFEMLSLLRERDVKFPILVFSGSLSRKDHESYARQCAGQKLNISFLQKPATSEQLSFEISKHLGLNKTYAPKNVQYSDAYLTKDQQAYFDEVVARAGKPSAEVQIQIDRIRAAKTQDELTEIVSGDANVVRPKIEAELLVAFMLAKQAELKPSINAKKLEEENHITQTTNHKLIGPCPKCKSEVLEGNTGYFCRAQGCGFKLGGVVMGQFLNSSQASKLFRDGRTDLLSEFISKHGRQFSAHLIIDEIGDVRFDFPKRDSQEFAAPPKQAAAKTVKAEKPAASLKENQKPQPKQKEFFNLIKAIGIVVLLFFGGVALLSAIFDKKDTSPKIEYTIVTTTINGQFYEKEATAEDLNSEFVTFADGTRVPWSAVKSTKSTISVNELSNALNVINTPPSKQ